MDVKSALGDDEIPPPATVEKCLRDAGLSRKQAKTLMAKGFAALRDAETTLDADSIKNTLLNAIKI
jgi:hypothetical protein